MKTICYNTTRQWNCGDEFILFGIRRIFDKVLGEHNSIIYNRNPDIRPANGYDIFYRNEKLPMNYNDYIDIQKSGAMYRYGFHDNSIKFNSDLHYVDLAIFAGTPEWTNARCINFYEHIIKNNMPCMILGVGSIPQNIPSYMEDVISKSILWTVRDKKYKQTPLSKKYGAIYLPCPALLSAPTEVEKNITDVKNIALVFGANFEHSVRCNCIDDKTYLYHIELYKKILKQYSQYKFSIICHYIDELDIAYKLFDKYDVDILYSYDAKDYINIYRNFDFVISPRVHGCGLASSLGIPNINISHDDRGTTCRGFLSEIIDNETQELQFYQTFEKMISEISKLNIQIIQHKNNVFNEYVNLIKKSMNKLHKITYSNNIDYSSCQISNIIYEPHNEIAKKSEIVKQTSFYKLFLCSFRSLIFNGNFKHLLSFNKFCKYRGIKSYERKN